MMKKLPKSVRGEVPLHPMSMAISQEEQEMYKRVAALENMSVSQWARNILTKVAKDSLARENNYRISEQLQELNKQIQGITQDQRLSGLVNNMDEILKLAKDAGIPVEAEEECAKQVKQVFGSVASITKKKP
jgi:hypothetical protein